MTDKINKEIMEEKMFYNGLGTGSIIERNNARINYVGELSKNKDMIRNLVNILINNLNEGKISDSDTVIKKLFYEYIDIENIKTLSNKVSKIYNMEKLKENIINACITKPNKGFVWNCYKKIIYFEA